MGKLTAKQTAASLLEALATNAHTQAIKLLAFVDDLKKLDPEKVTLFELVGVGLQHGLVIHTALAPNPTKKKRATKKPRGFVDHPVAMVLGTLGLLIAAVVLMVAADEKKPRPPPTQVSAPSGSGDQLRVIHDEKHRVTCWVTFSDKGVSCLPDAEVAR